MLSLVQQAECYPFLRLVIPLMAGILCGDACPEGYAFAGWIAVVVCFLLLPLLYKQKYLFGSLLFLTLFTMGYLLLHFRKEQSLVEWSSGKSAYIGIINGTPKEKPRSYLLPVEVERHDVYLYVAKDSLAATLRRGEKLLFYTQIERPDYQLPDGFDYGRYLLRHGVTGTAFVPSGYWQRSEQGMVSLSLKQRALDGRDRLLERYRLLGFEGDELAVLSALTLGDKSELRESLKETYSVTGAGHVLALSGLHVGILYSLCLFLFSFLHLGRATRVVKPVLSVAVLWGFALMVGLSTSVVRSAIMFSLFAVAQCLNRPNLSFNTLALSAFLMLLYNPFYLFDVGFQLSYAAVAAIIWLFPKVYDRWHPQSRVVRYLWGLVTVSFVAQLGVAPLLLYNFSRFSPYFLLTNLLVIPLTYSLVAGAIVMLCCGFCLSLQQAVANLLNGIIKLMNSGLAVIEQWPVSAIDRLVLTSWHVVCLYLILIFFVLFCSYRRPGYLIGALLSLLLLVLLWAVSLS